MAFFNRLLISCVERLCQVISEERQLDVAQASSAYVCAVVLNSHHDFADPLEVCNLLAHHLKSVAVSKLWNTEYTLSSLERRLSFHFDPLNYLLYHTFCSRCR
jgi:hypothetical protein